jgi:histidinol-phosphate aminotransferase
MDCSLGVNSKKLPDLIFTKLREFNNGPGEQDNEGDIKHYPHDVSLLQRLADYYKDKGVTWVNKENIILGAGSYDLLCNINMMCLTGGKHVLGHAPQFTAYVDHVVFSGSTYDCYKMTELEDNYRFIADKYIAAMKDTHSLFIVENPNNPTGQIIRLDDMGAIAAKAKELNTILVVDEAYGDYMPIANSTLNLLPEYPNIIVTRTFSKGFGMAGIRIGYAITSNPSISDTLEQLQKLERPFNCNGIARVLARAMLDSNVDTIQSDQVKANKEAVKIALNGLSKLNFATTDNETPIITIYYTGTKPVLDLQKFIVESAGLLTVSCSTYKGFDSKAVRVMLPETKDIPLLIEMLKRVEYFLVKEGY